MKIPAVYSLEVDLSGRHDHYEGVSEDATVPTVSLRWQPIQDLTVRATYSNSFVAPTLFQLFGPTSTGFSNPIATLGGDQAQVETGANPNLVPSKAESYTAGIVYSPHFIPGLTLTADFFRTWQNNIVSTVGGNIILNNVDQLGPASIYAPQVAFNNFPGLPGAKPVTAPGQLNGNLVSVFYLDPNVNIGGAVLEGFDYSANYNLDLKRWGQAQLGVNAVMFTQNVSKTTPQSNYFNVNGLDFAEGGGANPEYRITALTCLQL